MSDYTIADMERDFYLGSHQTCISKSNSMPVCRQSVYYMCLSYCHLKKYDSVERELTKAKDIDDLAQDEDGNNFGTTFLDAIKAFLIELTTNDPSDENSEGVKVIDQLESSKAMKPDDELSRIVASAVYSRHKLFAKALQVIDHLDSLKVSYSKIIVYIMMNRCDLAEKQLAQMQKKDELAPITELATAQVFLANRNPTQAWRIAISLTDRFRPTPLLNNLLTAAAICLGDYEPAKQFCEGSLDMDSDNIEALINMVHILSALKGSDQVIDRNLDRLKALYPEHEFVKELESIPAELEAL